MPSPIYIYHFTHIDNLPSIVENGLIADTRLSNDSYVNSGNNEIKERRKNRTIKFGGVVADYVPFYFAPRSPMMYTQQINNKIVEQQIIYLIAEVLHIINAYKWCCSDINAAKAMASFYETIEDLKKNISWDIMKSVMWNNTDQFPDRQDRRMAEFLVHDHVNWDDFWGIGVYDNNTRQKVTEIIKSTVAKPIIVVPDWYF